MYGSNTPYLNISNLYGMRQRLFRKSKIDLHQQIHVVRIIISPLEKSEGQ